MMCRKISGNTIGRILFSIVLLIVVLAIMIDPARCNANESFAPGISHLVGRLKSELKDVGIAHVLALAFLIPFIRSYAFRQPVRFDSLAVALLFSFAYVAGESMRAFIDPRFITLNTVQCFIALITLSGVTVLF